MLLESGKVYASGDNTHGQLGIRGIANSNFFQPVSGIPPLDKVVAISAGAAHSLVLLENGQVYASGDNTHGQLGIPGIANSNFFQPVSGIPVSGTPPFVKVVAIAAGGKHSLVLVDSQAIVEVESFV